MEMLAILGAVQGVLISIYLILKKSNQPANRYFAVAILLSSFQIISFLCSDYLILNNFLQNIRIISLINILIIPVFFYAYIKHLTQVHFRFRVQDMAHLILPFIGLLLVSPFLLMPHQEKLQTLYESDSLFLKLSVVSELVCSLVLIMYAFTYLSLIRRHREKIQHYYSNLQDRQLTWVRWFSWACILVGTIGTLESCYECYKLIFWQIDALTFRGSYNVVYSFVGVVFYWIVYKAMSQPEVFDFEYRANLRYGHSRVNQDNVTALADRVRAFMKQEQPFLDPNLNAADLAFKLQMSKHHLSQLLNQHFNQNFYDFINSYRIEEAKSLLTDPAYAHLTIAGIANEAGFRSKSTFYTLFKQHLGMTPAAFQKQAGPQLRELRPDATYFPGRKLKTNS